MTTQKQCLVQQVCSLLFHHVPIDFSDNLYCLAVFAVPTRMQTRLRSCACLFKVTVNYTPNNCTDINQSAVQGVEYLSMSTSFQEEVFTQG